MQIIFFGKHVEVTTAFREYAESKLSKLERLFDHVHEVHVVESILRNQHTVEVTLKADGTTIRAEERSPDMYSSIDLVTAKLERQLTRYKDRYVSHKRESLQGLKPGEINLEEIHASDAGESIESPAIMRTKRFAIKPMDPEEASQEMELIGHDFYVFRNADSEEVNVIYKRRDGNYGLIEPLID